MSKVKRKSEAWIDAALANLRARHLDRHITVAGGVGGSFTVGEERWLNFASNDYLDFARHPRLKAAAIQAITTYGVGATASRLVAGTLPLHKELEDRIAQHKGYPAALLFGSGYLTNAGVIPSLIGRHDHAFIDRLAHASIIDAVQRSGAQLHRFAHNDPQALAELLDLHNSGRKLVVTESVFSMDGDLAPLEPMAEVAAQHDALLLVDEAHAGGVFGPGGSGRVAALGLHSRVDLSMGTLSKAIGGYGGYVACSDRLREWLINTARAFIYTTALPPPVLAAADAAFQLLDDQPNLGEKLLKKASTFRQQLQAAGLDTLQSESQIVPVRVADNEAVLRVAQRLKSEHILVGAIRPPTVPPGSARLRLSVTLAHTDADLERTAAAIDKAISEEERR